MYSLLIPIRAFPSDGRTTWVRRYGNIHKGFDAYCMTNTSWYVHVRTINLTSQMTRLSEFSDAEYSSPSACKALGATLIIHRPTVTTLRLRAGCP
jgi:hypothetical protein